MRIWLTICAGFALWFLALPAGWIAAALAVFLVLCSSALGAIAGRFLQVDEPFLEFTVGVFLLSLLALIGLTLLPTHGQLILFLFAIGLGTSVLRPNLRGDVLAWLPALTGAMAALIAVLWNADNLVRLELFQTTGRLDFWVDILVHASRIEQLGGAFAAGRGNVLLADFPAPLYHTASYALPALTLAGSNANALAIATLMWIPLGTLVMATGVAALGHSLGGKRLAFWTLPALALVPALDLPPLFEGQFSTPWLLEAGPGAYYGCGAACAMLALLVLWMKTAKDKLLLAAITVLMGTFFVRANFFLWLGPLLAFAAIYEPRERLSRYLGTRPEKLLAIATAALILLLLGISWRNIATDPQGFLLGYIFSNSPVEVRQIESLPLRSAVLALVAVPILVSMQGLWLPLMMALRMKVRAANTLKPWDRIPFLLMLVAAVFLFLGPRPPNGDLSEFRHRGGPLLLIVTMVWSVHFLVVILTPFVERMQAVPRLIVLLGGLVLTFISLPFTSHAAKEPRMAWGDQYFGKSFSPGLHAVAKDLSRVADRQSRFVVAGGSPDARLFDDAVVIVAESGVPAYFSCPQSILLRKDAYGDDARRRVLVQRQLDSAASPSQLRDSMIENGISHYVVTSPDYAVFDSDRQLAAWAEGGMAIYSARHLADKITD